MKQLLGGCLQAVGILIAGLTGLCTAVMLISVSSWRSFTNALETLVFFAVPFAIGLGLIFAGRALTRSAGEGDY